MQIKKENIRHDSQTTGEERKKKGGGQGNKQTMTTKRPRKANPRQLKKNDNKKKNVNNYLKCKCIKCSNQKP